MNAAGQKLALLSEFGHYLVGPIPKYEYSLYEQYGSSSSVTNSWGRQ